MFDSLLSQLEETHDRKAVMILLQGVDVPMAVLSIKSEALKGELWISNGSQIVYAKVLPTGDGGLIDMLRLLAVDEADFTLEVRDEKPPPCQVTIRLSEVVADEHAVARKIKNVLWPVEEPTLGEASSAAQEGLDSSSKIKRRRPRKRSVEELEITRVREAASEEALANYAERLTEPESAEASKDKAESKDDKAKDPAKSIKLSDFCSEDPADKTQEIPAKASKPEETQEIPLKKRPEETQDIPLKKPQVEDAKPKEEEPDTSEETQPIPTSDKAKESSPNKAALGEAVLKELDQVLSEQSLGSLFDEDDAVPTSGKSSSTAALSAKADTKSKPIDLPAPPPIPPPPPGGPKSKEAAAKDENAVAAQAGAKGDKKTASKESQGGLTAKQRAEYQALNVLMGETAEKFYEKTSAAEQMSEEDLSQRRKEETAALSKMLAEEARGDKRPPPSLDPNSTSDELKSRRRADYEALKLFYSEEPGKFDEGVGLDNKMGDGGLTDFQRRILELTNEQTREEGVFNEHDQKLESGQDIRPSWEVPEPPKPFEEEKPPGLPVTPDEEYLVQKVESPYSATASDVATSQTLRKKLALEAEEADPSLLTRQRDAKHEFTSIPEREFQRQPQTQLVMWGVGGTIFIAVTGFVVWHSIDSQSQEDMARQRQEELLLERSVDQKSVVVKPQEPFRMPAGNVSGVQSSSGGGVAQKPGITTDEHNAHFDYQEPKNPVIISAMEAAQANVEIAKGDVFVAATHPERAVGIYTDVVHRYPTYVIARVKLVRAYIAMRKYQDAYQIGISGLSICQTRTDFDMLQAAIQEIPSQ